MYGLLRATEDEVVVHVAAKAYISQRVAIPAALGMHGVLAYSVLPKTPEEIRVQTASGEAVLADQIPPLFSEHCHPGTLVTIGKMSRYN